MYYILCSHQTSEKHQESLSSTCFPIQSMGSQQKTWSYGLHVPTNHDADVEDVVVYADGSSVKERRLKVISVQKESCHPQ